MRQRTVVVAFALGFAVALVLYRCGLKFDYSMVFGLSTAAAHVHATESGAYERFTLDDARTLVSYALGFIARHAER